MKKTINRYTSLLSKTLEQYDWTPVQALANAIEKVWKEGTQVFLCGNGGSAANANHAANDFIYGLSPKGKGLRAHSFCANASVNSCLANDIGYENVFSRQVQTLGVAGDLLVVFSGSGNSLNILNAIEAAKENGILTAGILGYDGGKAKEKLDIPIHFPVNDMQISEDLQMIVVHMIVQFLKR